MNRAERRRQARKRKRDEATYSVNKNGLRKLTHEVAEEQLAEARAEGMNDALLLMWALPLMVLRDHFWQKSFQRQAKKFCEELFDLYSQWQDGGLDISDIRNDLWEYGGIRLERGEDS